MRLTCLSGAPFIKTTEDMLSEDNEIESSLVLCHPVSQTRICLLDIGQSFLDLDSPGRNTTDITV